MTIPASDLLTRLRALLAERDKWVLVSVAKKWDAEHKVFDLMPEIAAALSQQQEMHSLAHVMLIHARNHAPENAMSPRLPIGAAAAEQAEHAEDACPSCGCTSSRVVDTGRDTIGRWRRRRCQNPRCLDAKGRRSLFVTREVLDSRKCLKLPRHN